MYLKLIKYYFTTNRYKKLSIETVRDKQLKAFSDLFDYAKSNSPFYKKFYSENGIANLKIRSWDDVDKVPIVDKNILKQYMVQERMTCPINSELVLHTTSGSTGEPFKVYQNKFEEFTSHVRVFSLLRRTGYHPFKKIVMISRYDPKGKFDVEKEFSLLSKLQKAIGVFQREIISIYEDPKDILKKIQSSKAYILWGTPSILEMVCNEAINQNIKLNFPYVILTSETLLERQYCKFKNYIGKNIISHYGLMECPTVSYEVNRNGLLSVFSNSVLVQYIKNGGEQGIPVITNLVNYTMPFIRYSTNDTSFVLDNPEFPNRVMGTIIGRLDDTLTLPDGNSFVHHHAHEIFMDFSECEQFKFIQQNSDKIILQLKVRNDADKEYVKGKAIERWSKRFPIDYLEIQFVEMFSIDLKTGKFKNIEKLCR
jgi:phenylacetate-coenzyme A ligase PaaK-like adenylate-forming protein